VVDLSFPLSVRAEARASLGDSFADVDRIFREAASLQAESETSRDFRADAAAIVDEGVSAYRSWSAGRASVSTLRALRDRSEEQRAAELSRLLRRLPGLEPRERELVEAFSERLIAGLLHGPTVALRDDVDGSAARAAERLFGL
jgi:glutamyl-tRNA reductase